MTDEKILPPGKLPGDLLDRMIRTYKTAVDASVIIDSSYGFDAAAIKIGGDHPINAPSRFGCRLNDMFPPRLIRNARLSICNNREQAKDEDD